MTKNIRDSFGIFIPSDSEKVHQVKLKFNKQVAKYIQSLILHPDQEEQIQSDGSIVVSFFSTINPELISEILKFRDDVVLLDPPEARQLVKDTIIKMLKNYPE